MIESSSKSSTRLLFPKNRKWSTYCCEWHRNKGLSDSKLISDVFYVLEINQNLISVSQLLAKGYKVSFEHNLCD